MIAHKFTGHCSGRRGS